MTWRNPRPINGNALKGPKRPQRVDTFQASVYVNTVLFRTRTGYTLNILAFNSLKVVFNEVLLFNRSFQQNQNGLYCQELSD